MTGVDIEIPKTDLEHDANTMNQNNQTEYNGNARKNAHLQINAHGFYTVRTTGVKRYPSSIPMGHMRGNP